MPFDVRTFHFERGPGKLENLHEYIEMLPIFLHKLNVISIKCLPNASHNIII